MKSPSLTQKQILSDYHFEEHGETRMWVSRNFVDGSFVRQLLDCDQLLARQDCQIIKDQKKIKVGRMSLTIDGQVLHMYIKRYNAFSLRYRFGSVMADSGAVKSLGGAAVLRDAGIATARPLAAVETRINRMLTKSFFLTEEIAGGKTADAYWLADLAPRRDSLARQLRQEFLRGLAATFRSLHAAQIYHNDLKDANILAVSGTGGSSPTFFLLDLEGVKKNRNLSQKRRIKNLVQINRTLGRYLRRGAKLYFLKVYMGERFAQKSERKRLIRTILAESNRLDRLKGLAPVGV